MKTFYYYRYSKTICLLLTLFLLASCNRNYSTVNIKDQYQLDVPSNFKKVNDLNKEASLQYQNDFEKLYLIVIDEPKTVFTKAIIDNGLQDRYTDDLKGYADLITDGMENSIAVKEMPPFEELSIGGNKARELSFDGVSSGNHVYWKLAFIEGQNHYYQIMVWTEADNKGKYEKKMNTIVNSFKETDRSSKR
ncbi:hypothetical protein R1T16_03470 [Flavobacterium sp. DG1-102-2]|uniref:hypothetical protein n=1 Tax=Flavobacterium sp. DG1-102-2 TaxID=3081663 RepID=UPI00294A7B44|nr:hypothetical protein [Flavobacterium sp. DG1-102-2]MDV6167470.1 hypothetical protein [Flavobacterium sp. DG1-102-2]